MKHFTRTLTLGLTHYLHAMTPAIYIITRYTVIDCLHLLAGQAFSTSNKISFWKAFFIDQIREKFNLEPI